MARTTAASGVPNVAAMPPAAPHASRILRSDGDTGQHLADEGAEGAAGDDDRTLGAERAAGADGDRRRQRLGHRGAGMDPALLGEDGFHGLGDAVAADLGRPPGQERHQRVHRWRRRSRGSGPDGSQRTRAASIRSGGTGPRSSAGAMRWTSTYAAPPASRPSAAAMSDSTTSRFGGVRPCVGTPRFLGRTRSIVLRSIWLVYDVRHGSSASARRPVARRREWDSNPRWVAPHTLSKRADSAALASLQAASPPATAAAG